MTSTGGVSFGLVHAGDLKGGLLALGVIGPGWGWKGPKGLWSGLKDL